MSLVQALTPQIPFEAAAPFLVRLKTAGWTDPPDVTGALEGPFNAAREVVLDRLKGVLAAKARLMLAWHTYAQSLKGDSASALQETFEDHAALQQEGFTYYAKRAAALGGPVHIDAIEPPPPASDPSAIFTIMVRGLQESILLQRELQDLVGDQNPMRAGVACQMLCDQKQLDSTWQLLPQGQQPLGSPTPAAAPPVAEEVVPQEQPPSKSAPTEEAPMKEASVRFKQTAQALRQKEAGVGRGPLQEALQGVVPAVNPLKRYGQLLSGGRLKLLENAASQARSQTLRDSAHLAARAQSATSPQQIGGVVGQIPGLRAATNEAQDLRSLADTERLKVLFTRGATAGAPLGAGVALAQHHAQKKEAEAKDDALRATGRDRAVTNLAAEAHREAGRRGERAGSILGGIGGALGGAVLGGKHLKTPMNSGKALGTTLGYLAGRSAGKELGTEVDIQRNKSKTAGVADVAPAFGGLSAGYGMGANAAEHAARAVAPRQQGAEAGSSARRLAMIAAPAAGLGAMVAAHKLKAVPRALGALERFSPAGLIAEPAVEQEIARLAVPAGAALGGSVLGGALAGGAVGAAKHKEAEAFSQTLPEFGETAPQGLREAVYKDIKPSKGQALGQGAFGGVGGGLLGAYLASKAVPGVGRPPLGLGALVGAGIGAGAGLVQAHRQDKRLRADLRLGQSNPIDHAGEGVDVMSYVRDASKQKQASETFMRALRKLAFGGPPPNGGQAAQGMMPPAAPQLPPEAAPPVGMEQPAEEPQPAASALEQSPFEAMNYIGAERAGRDAQEQNESAYYRQKFQQAMQQLELVQSDATAAQASAEQLQQQHALVNQDVSSATNEALEANVEATRQAQAAANLRIGLEKMRQQMMGLLSQDPELLAQTPSMDPSLGDPGLGQPAVGGDPASGAVPAQQPPGTPPAGAGTPGDAGAEPSNASGGSGTVVNISAQPNEKKASLKEHLRSAAPWALGGAAIGGVLGAIPQHAQASALRERVRSLEATREPGDYTKARELSKSYQKLHDAERVNASPLRGAAAGALLGGATLAGIGPEVMKNIKTVRTYLH